MDDKRIFFMSGLQRSGSTVLCNILQQHPDVFTVPTDPFFEVIDGTMMNVFENKIGSAFDFEVFDKGLHQFLLDGLQGWYKSLTDKPVIVSKNRNWHKLSHLFPDAKFIVTVRDLFDFADSMLRKQYSNLSMSSPLVDGSYIKSSNSKDYIEHHVFTDEGLQRGLKNLIYLHEKDRGRVEFIRYEDLVHHTSEALRCVHDHLDIKPFEYDLNNIQQQSLYEHDGYYMGQCSHVTKSKLQPPSNTPALSEEVRDILRSHELTSWFYDIFYPVDQR